MNKIMFNLVKSFDDDDLFDILVFVTQQLKKRGYELYDILCIVNDHVKEKGE